MELHRLILEMRKKFVYIDDVAKVLHLGFTTSENVVLYGPGGHAKTDSVLEFFKLMDIKPFVKVLGKGTTVEDLFGGLNIPLFQATGKLEYFVENSFLANEYVMLEEGFDIPMQVMEQLKDPLMSGQFKNGNQVFDVKTKFIVICTNRSKQELADDDSIKALMERFPLELKVSWESYKAADYSAMFRVVFPSHNVEELAVIIEKVNEHNFISPRTAVKAAKIYIKYGSNIENLQFVTGFSAGIIANISESLRAIREEAAVNTKFTLVRSKIDNLIKADVDLQKSTSSIQLFQTAKVWEEILIQLKKLRITDSNYSAYQKLLETVGLHKKALELAGMSLIDLDLGNKVDTHKQVLKVLQTV